MELLSPAGSFAALKAAVYNGADAVYFGGSLFNARLGAENFTQSTICDAIDFCHANNVRAFITMNTLTSDRDIVLALSFAAWLYENGADALIVQDIGLLTLLRKYMPEFEIHASTQMCISNLDGVKFCKDLGISRVVLSRELSLADISHISKNCDMPLEVFVHGAMCMSFSGGCLFSSMVGARSGNCGSCAQPCRKYAAIDRFPKKTDLALSLGDLCVIDHLKEIENAGAMSLKIEGRMKKPEYIAAVTYAYRRALNGAGKDEIAELKQQMHSVFNRGEFSTGYYFGDNDTCNRVANANPSPQLLSAIHERKPVCKKQKIDMHLSAKTGECALLRASACNKTVEVTGAMVEAAKKPVTEQTIERCTEQLTRLGETSFEAGNITADITGFLPISSINELRRSATQALSKALAIRRKKIEIPREIKLSSPTYTSGQMQLICARVNSVSQAFAAKKAGANEIYLEYGSFTKAEVVGLQSLREDAKLFASLPVAVISEKAQLNMEKWLDEKLFDGVEINNPAQIAAAMKFKHKVGGLYLNVYNSHTAAFYLEQGLERVTVSPELNMQKIDKLTANIGREKLMIHSFGRVALMNLFHCPVKEAIGCEKCNGKRHILIDDARREFPVFGMKSAPCSPVRLYNCVAHDVLGIVGKNSEKLPLHIMLGFTDEDEQTVFERTACARQKDVQPLANTTRGYFNK